ncbi:M48 family metalloprotease [Reichenbachiella versicolor]|uniref:M48 family metalloprotease n=1 Tax=Reichenbachiella versicolor TaxID=1821036 RepID=UPI000D6E329F|nr:M48 family metallopeptidase [Reichenbachiella versicolor]
MSASEVKLTAEFKAQTTRSILAIALFAITYILLFLLALVLTVACVTGGIALVIEIPKFVTLALGVGLASLGILVLVFLVKFIFKTNKVDRSHLLEIKRSDEPELFAMIDDIVQRVDTRFPKRVYLSADVNASVFYDSSFWSMFFPVKKNLMIGIGLVNSVSKSELKAILAHEFGHFSQRTMKVGSFVYNVNQVIFNMLYENDSYDKAIQGWASVSGYFFIFVFLAVKIVGVIQWILKQLYSVVNKSYMALSREMEFHADEIAASVTGYEPLKSSLMRLSFAEHAYQSVLSFYDGKISDNYKAFNLYQNHESVMSFMASEYEIKIENGFPNVTLQDENRYNKSKLIIEDQWASHPSTEDRVDRLEKTILKATSIDWSPATSLFKDWSLRNEQLTDLIFSTVQYKEEKINIDDQRFKEEYKQQLDSNSFSKLYNGYYDDKNPIPIDLTKQETTDKAIEDLFSQDVIDLVYTSISMKGDIETLKQIASKNIDVKSFDYDGRKYRRKNAKTIAKELEVKFEKLQALIKINDQHIYSYFLKLEKEYGDSQLLTSLYESFFDYDKVIDEKYELTNSMMNDLEFIQMNTPFDQIVANFGALSHRENKLKDEIEIILNNEDYKEEITPDIESNFKAFIENDLRYFRDEQYIDSNLEVLFAAIHNYNYILSRSYFIKKKGLLEYQKSLFDKVG